jgi:hypothetical protein
MSKMPFIIRNLPFTISAGSYKEKKAFCNRKITYYNRFGSYYNEAFQQKN